LQREKENRERKKERERDCCAMRSVSLTHVRFATCIAYRTLPETGRRAFGKLRRGRAVLSPPPFSLSLSLSLSLARSRSRSLSLSRSVFSSVRWRRSETLENSTIRGLRLLQRERERERERKRETAGLRTRVRASGIRRAESKPSNSIPDPINGLLVESRAACSAMDVTTIVIERNCTVREGESSLIAAARRRRRRAGGRRGDGRTLRR